LERLVLRDNQAVCVCVSVSTFEDDNNNMANVRTSEMRVALKSPNTVYIICRYISVLLTQYCAGGKIEKNEIGGACGAYGGGERCAQVSGGET
jgi:hypothetical protein